MFSPKVYIFSNLFVFIALLLNPLIAATNIPSNSNPKTLPDRTAFKLVFIDSNPAINKIQGEIVISPSRNETKILHYIVYWGKSKDKKQSETPIVQLPASGGEKIIFEFKSAISIPQKPKATHLLIFTKNEFGEMKSGISIKIRDKGSFIFINAGSYIIGSDSGKSDESPPRRVTFEHGFFMLDHEVTASEYLLCVTDGDCAYNGSKKSPLRTYKVSGKENFPINYVNWFDAKDYATWHSRKYKKKYRLCHENEWEYVARAGTQTPWSCGETPSCIKSSPWFGESSESVPYQTMKGSPNPWGVYDIHDNVYEWLNDWYNPYPISGGSELHVKEAEKSSARVIRGGIFKHTAENLRSAIRGYLSPGDRLSFLGIRLCAD